VKNQEEAKYQGVISGIKKHVQFYGIPFEFVSQTQHPIVQKRQFINNHNEQQQELQSSAETKILKNVRNGVFVL
jgi:hypothetical protein